MAELYALHRLTLDAPGAPVFAAIAEAIPGLSRRQAREAIAAGLVRVGGAVERAAKAALPAQAVAVEVDLRHGIRKIRAAQRHVGADVEATARPFEILHEDVDLVVVDKAAGVLSAPNMKGAEAERGHVPELLRAHWRKQGRKVPFIGTLHRLDRDTSGCLVFALNRPAQRLCAAQFAGGAATRIYRCFVVGQPREDAVTIDAPLGRDARSGRRDVVDEDQPGKPAVTHARVLRRFPLGAELEVRLETGRTHQIRVHLASIGCPVWGDRVYGRRDYGRRDHASTAPRPPRLMLHAWRLELDHPGNGRRLTVEAPPPPAYVEFGEVLARAKPADGRPDLRRPRGAGDAPAPRGASGSGHRDDRGGDDHRRDAPAPRGAGGRGHRDDRPGDRGRADGRPAGSGWRDRGSDAPAPGGRDAGRGRGDRDEPPSSGRGRDPRPPHGRGRDAGPSSERSAGPRRPRPR